MLTITDHSRDSLALNYIYVVASRRAGGLSIGINLNTNNACNWRCIYCQVPDLRRGNAPQADLELLERELASVYCTMIFLKNITYGLKTGSFVTWLSPATVNQPPVKTLTR